MATRFLTAAEHRAEAERKLALVQGYAQASPARFNLTSEAVVHATLATLPDASQAPQVEPEEPSAPEVPAETASAAKAPSAAAEAQTEAKPKRTRKPAAAEVQP